ncbi:MAG TPA: DivIVA domain-containing protein [Friedmanniella sp.]
MEWFIAALAVVALGVAAVVAAGGGGSMDEPVRDTYAMALPESPLDAAAVRQLRFGVALRGYAMDQVDAVLDRVAAELEAQADRIARLEAQLAPAGTVSGEPVLAPAPAVVGEDWREPR